MLAPSRYNGLPSRGDLSERQRRAGRRHKESVSDTLGISGLHTRKRETFAISSPSALSRRPALRPSSRGRPMLESVSSASKRCAADLERPRRCFFMPCGALFFYAERVQRQSSGPYRLQPLLVLRLRTRTELPLTSPPSPIFVRPPTHPTPRAPRPTTHPPQPAASDHPPPTGAISAANGPGQDGKEAVAGCGRPVAGYGWPWPAMASHGQPWAATGQPRPATE